jgi:hypothetical protein
MANPIQVYSRNVYGIDRTYAIDPLVSDSLQTLTGQRTLSAAQLDALRELGHRIELVHDPRAKYGKTVITTKDLPATLS